MASGQVAAHVPEFLEVGPGLAFGGLDAERGVTALAGAAFNQVLALDVLRQGEKAPRYVE